MALFRLPENQVRQFREHAEAAMGLHIVTAPQLEFPAFIVGGVVLQTLLDDGCEQTSEVIRQPWIRRDSQMSQADRAERFTSWLRGLPVAEKFTFATIQRDDFVLAFRLLPRGYLPPPPAPPKYVYGQLPLSGVTELNDVFYRCEPWPTSRRIDQANQTVDAGTFAWPASELPLVPTGFAAVARYALPSLLPACFRWELQPQPGAQMDCGASVPLFGQSGGGVEVRFRNQTTNRGPIANPVVLPVL